MIAALLVLTLMPVWAQNVTVTATINPSAALILPDNWVNGGKIRLELFTRQTIVALASNPFAGYGEQNEIDILVPGYAVAAPVRFYLTLENQAIKFDNSRPPIAYYNDWTQAQVSTSSSDTKVTVTLAPAPALRGKIFALTIENFWLDVLDSKTGRDIVRPGDVIEVQVNTDAPNVMFTNPIVRMLRVTAPVGTRR
jgi:hypothetical protein